MTNYPPGVSESTREAPWNLGPKSQAEEDMFDELHALQRGQEALEWLKLELGWSDLILIHQMALAEIEAAMADRIRELEQKLGVE